jgi:hypothetical protein
MEMNKVALDSILDKISGLFERDDEFYNKIKGKSK